jgi:hypothetical protein
MRKFLASLLLSTLAFTGLNFLSQPANAVGGSDNANLASLRFTPEVGGEWWSESHKVAMTPRFDKDQTFYQGFAVLQALRLSAAPEDSGATISVTGGGLNGSVFTDAVILNFPAKANNLVSVNVTSADGKVVKTYKVNFSSVVMPQPEILSISTDKLSTSGGDIVNLTVKNVFGSSNASGATCYTQVQTSQTYKNDAGDSTEATLGYVKSVSNPDKNGNVKIIFISGSQGKRFSDVSLKSTLRVTNYCQTWDETVGNWQPSTAISNLPNAFTNYLPTVSSITAPATISQMDVIKIYGQGVTDISDLEYFLENPVTKHRIYFYNVGFSGTNSVVLYLDPFNYDDEWNTAKKLTLNVRQYYYKNGYDDDLSAENYTYRSLYSKEINFTPETPTQVSLTGAKGSLAGGNVVKINGHHLYNYRYGNPIIKIGGQNVSSTTALDARTWDSSSNEQYDGIDRFTFVAPPSLKSGSFDITVDIGRGPVTLSQKYVYSNRPTISSITPGTVANSGGSMLTIDGADFGISGTPTVTIDGEKSPYVIRVSPSKVLAMVPSSTSTGPVEVNLISSSGGGALDAPAIINFAAASANPVITKVTPAFGAVAGGESIVITGSGFSTTATGVTIGGVGARVTAATATSLTVETPSADAAGMAAIVVGTPTGAATLNAGFDYRASNGINGISPSVIKSTDVGNATKVTISGLGFGSKGTIKVGSGAAVAYSATASGTTISGIQIPTSVAGSVIISVTPTGAKEPFSSSVSVVGPTISYVGSNPKNEIFLDTNPFNGNYSAGNIIDVKTTGGDELRVEGKGFGATGKIKIGNTIVTTTTYSDTAITFTSPVLAKGVYDLTVIPTVGKLTATKKSTIVTSTPLANGIITQVESNVDNARSAPRYTFAPAEDTSDLFTISGTGFLGGDGGASTKVQIGNAEDYWGSPNIWINVSPVTISANAISFHAPKNMNINQWAFVRVTTNLNVISQKNAIYYTGQAPQPVLLSQYSGLCTKDAISVYTPAVVTATGDAVFGATGTVSLGGTVLPAGAVSWSASSVTVDLSKQTNQLADPWGSKQLVFTPDDSSLIAKTWSFNCSVATNVTTKLNGSTDPLTIAAGTNYTASAQIDNPLPGTTFVPADKGYTYQSVSDYSIIPWGRNVKSGLPVAAGEWRVRVNKEAAAYDAVKYGFLGYNNDVLLTITGNPVTFTPKLTAGGSSIAYRGQLGDGTLGSNNDISYTKTPTTDAVTGVNWEYRNSQCGINDPNYGWSSGLPNTVAIADQNCGGDGVTVTTWDIRVASYEMLVGGVDKTIFYLPTFNIFKLSITKKNLTLTAVKSEKVYDGTTSVSIGDLTVTGAIDGDEPTIDSSVTAGASYENATVGANKAITLSGPLKLSGTWDARYVLTNPGLVIKGTITKAKSVVRLITSSSSVILGQTPTVQLTVSTNDSKTGQAVPVEAGAAAAVLVNKSTSVCTLSGTTVTPIKAGDCVIEATQAASTNYFAGLSYKDDTTNVEVAVIKIYGAPKILSVIADDIQIAAGEGVSPSSTTTGLLEGDTFDNVNYQYFSGTTLLGSAPTTVGTYKIVPSQGAVTAIDATAYNSSVKYVAAKLVITALPPVINALSPAHGPEKGGNKATINGTGLSAITSITIGDKTIRKPSFVVNGTGTSVTFTIPAGKGGLPITLNAGSAKVGTDYTYDPPPVVIDSPFKIDLKLDLKTGVRLAGQSLTVSGSGLKPNSEYTLVMRSTPLLILKGEADEKGNFKKSLIIPEKACLAPGLHSLKLDGVNTANKAVSDTGYFTLADKCLVGAQAVKIGDKSWTLSGFLFAYRSAVLNKGGISSLDALVSFIKGAKSVEILGYTETDTKSAAIKKSNLILAKARTETVKAYLKSKGIVAKWTTVGKGGVNPVDLKDQSKNRRVVINAKY